jgi:hypothetical protein
MTDSCSTHGEMRNVSRMLDGKSEKKKNSWETWSHRRWILCIRCENVDWIHLAQNKVQWLALVNTVL